MSIEGELWEEQVTVLQARVKHLEILISFLCKELSYKQIEKAKFLTDDEEIQIQERKGITRKEDHKKWLLSNYKFYLMNDTPSGDNVCHFLKLIDDEGLKILHGPRGEISLIEKGK